MRFKSSLKRRHRAHKLRSMEMPSQRLLALTFDFTFLFFALKLLKNIGNSPLKFCYTFQHNYELSQFKHRASGATCRSKARFRVTLIPRDLKVVQLFKNCSVEYSELETPNAAEACGCWRWSVWQDVSFAWYVF